MKTVKELLEALAAAHQKCEAAFKAREEVEAKEAKTDEEKQTKTTEIDELQKQYDAGQKDFADLKVKVEEARKVAQDRADRKAAIESMAALSKPEDVVTSKVDGQVQAAQTDAAKAVDPRDRERAHYDAMRSWLLDEEDDLPGQKRELIESKALRFTKGGHLVPRNLADAATGRAFGNECVLPKSMSAMIWGMSFGPAQMTLPPELEGKVVLSTDNAVTNPSLAHNLVPQEFKPTLLQLPMPPATVLGLVTRLPTNTGELTFPTLTQSDSNEFGAMVWEWIDEATSKPETEPNFGQITIPCHELAGYTELSHKILIRSAIALEPLLAQISQAGLRHEMENVILNGTGAAFNQPLGVLNTTGVRTVARNAANAVDDADLVALKHLVQFYHRQGSYWILNDDVEEYLETTYDNEARPLFRASTASGPYDRLVGYRYYVSNNSPALGTAGDVIFGNFKYYYLVIEEDITIAKSDHYRFRQNRRAIKVFVNVGGRPAQPRAFAYLGGAGS